MDLFTAPSYKAYLLGKLGEKGSRSGLRLRLAKSIGCQSSFLSQILNGAQHLSLEQAQKTSVFLQHGELEQDYFLALVLHDRAGTKQLQEYWKGKIAAFKKDKFSLKKRIAGTKSLTMEQQATYYGAWYYAAIHVALSVPGLGRVNRLSEYFGLPAEIIIKVLDFHLQCGLAKMGGEEYLIGPNHIHVGKESTHLIRHHTNCRLAAIRKIEQGMSGLHYSAAVTLSREDANKIKEILTQQLKENLQKISISKEEEVFCYNFDFFSLGKD